MRADKKAVAKYLFCLGILEGKAFQLFGRISEKVESPRMKFSLLYIAYNSLKDSVILGELGKSLAISEVKAKDYAKILGGVWKMVGDLSKEILKVEKIKGKDLTSLVDKLITIYAITLVELKTLRFLSKEISETYNVDLEVLNDIFELLIEDENTDTQILMTIKDVYSRKPETAADRTPAVRYTDPDMWNRPVAV